MLDGGHYDAWTGADLGVQLRPDNGLGTDADAVVRTGQIASHEYDAAVRGGGPEGDPDVTAGVNADAGENRHSAQRMLKDLEGGHSIPLCQLRRMHAISQPRPKEFCCNAARQLLFPNVSPAKTGRQPA